MDEVTSRLKEIVATGIVPGTGAPGYIDSIQCTGGDQGDVNSITLTDGSGGPVVGYARATANTTTVVTLGHSGRCTNGVYVSAFTNTGNAKIIVGHL